jgi:hypothetical protein
VRTPANETGAFQVQYSLISSIDGHPTRGAFIFKVQGPVDCASATGQGANAAVGTGLWDIPRTPFFVALLVAAAIGAAGGFVYAGIMGPRRTR